MKGSSRFYSSLLLLIILNLVIKPVWILGIDRQVQNVVGLSAYGQYFSLLNLSIICSFLLDWGLTTFYSRQLAAKQPGAASIAGDFFGMKLILVFFFAIVVAGIAWFTGVRDWQVLTGVICIQALTSLFLFFRAIITAEQFFRADAWLSVLDKFLMILLCAVFLYWPASFGAMTIPKFLYLQAICLGIAIGVAIIILFRKRVRLTLHRLAFLKRKTIKAALPYALIVLVMSLHYRLDGFLLGRLSSDGAYQAGIYASAYRLLDAANMIGFLFASFLFPYVARKQPDRPAIESAVLNIRHLLIVLATGIACTGIFLSPWIQQTLYGNTDPDSIIILQWCLPAIIGYSLVHIYGTVLTATGNIGPFLKIAVMAVLINAVLNLLLIPQMGARGSCIAALISQSGCGIVTMWFVKKKLGVPVHRGSILIYIFIAALLGILFYWGGKGGTGEGLLLAAGVAAAFCIMIITKLFRPSTWFQLITKSQPGT